MKTNGHIVQGIKNYLSSDSTDYAVMICGEWGTGKTYFLRHTLREEVFCKPIEKIKEDGEKESIHFRSIYISLAGMKSLEMLETRLREKINAFYPFNRENRVIANEGILLEEILSPESREDDLEDGWDWIPSDTVLCFDDLERMEPSESSSVLSYIHLFAEHTHTKVIFICDENKIEGECKFPSIKEKYIRYTFRYEADLQSIIQVNSHVPEEYKPLIKDIFERAGCCNIRTLKQVLSQFIDIEKWVTETRVVPDEWKDEITKSVILFQCFYTIEKNKGTEVELLDLLRHDRSIFQPESSTSNTIKQVPGEYNAFIDLLQRTYLGKEDFFRFDSLASYFTKGYLDKNVLAQELSFRVEQLKSFTQNSEVTDLLDKTKNIHLLSKEEFPDYWRRLTDELPKGSFTLVNYLEIYRQLLWLESLEINGIVIDEDFTDLFKTGVKTVTEKNDFQYVEHLKEQNSVYEFSNKQKYTDFLAYTNTMNFYAYTNRINSWSNFINEVFSAENIEGVYTLISNRGNLASLTTQDAEILFNNLVIASPTLVYSVVDSLPKRYVKQSEISSILQFEKDFINKLSELTKGYLNDISEKNIEVVNFYKLDSYLDQLKNILSTNNTSA